MSGLPFFAVMSRLRLNFRAAVA